MRLRLPGRTRFIGTCILLASSLQLFAFREFSYSKINLAGVAYNSKNADKISGKVTDDQGIARYNVTVMVKETSIGTTTDYNGNYTIQIEKGQTLVFSFVGYISQEIIYKGQNRIDIELKASAASLDEVVVVGYGRQKKESVVGAISQIRGDAILKQNVPEVANALAGLLPGLATIQSSSLPGGSGVNDKATEIYIRGRSTWNEAQPLVLVDGVERSIDDVDPYEIDKISVLKDASATAVFGVKGANGVILITTKRGITGKSSINVDVETTVNTLSRQPNVMNSYDGNYQKNIAILNEVAVNPTSWADYKPQQILNYYKTQQYPDLFPDVNWLDEFTNKYSMSQRANLNVSGGTKFAKYFGSLSYLGQGDIIATKDYGQGYTPSFGYQRFNFRSNLDFNISKSTKLSVNLSGFYGAQKSPNGNNSNYATFWKSLYGHPPDVYPVRYSDGTWGENPAFDKYLNGITNVNFNGVKSNNRTQINTDLALDQKLDFITKGLSIGGRLSLDNYFITEGPNITDVGIVTKYLPPSVISLPENQWEQYAIYSYPAAGQSTGYNYSGLPNTYSNEVAQTTGEGRATDYQFNLNYQGTFANNDISGLFLFKRRESDSSQDFLNYEEDWVGRLTYSYSSKYLVEVNGAYNGSEKFDRKYRFGFFPSVGLGWVISKETFFKKALPFVNLMKFRYSNGKVGNDLGIARWQYVSNWDPLTSTWRFGAPFTSSTGIPITLEGAIANPDIHWETDHKQDAGVDAEFFKGNLTLTYEYFWNTNTDIFVSADQRTGNDIFGAPLPSANLGETKTHGWELDLGYKHNFNKNLSLNLRYTQSFVKNEIIRRDDPLLLPDYQKQAGFAIGQTRTQVNQPGIIQSWDQLYTGVLGQDNTQQLPGNFRQIDFNADGVIDQNDAVPYAYSNIPEYTHSLLIGMNYKAFNASILLYGVWNVSLTTNYDEFNEGYTVVRGFQAETAWNPEAGITTSATYPGLRLYTYAPKGNWGVEDGSYTRIKSAELGYRLNQKALKRFKMSKMQIFFRGYNLALWSKMREDRESQNGCIANRTMSYPLTKSFTLGLSAGF